MHDAPSPPPTSSLPLRWPLLRQCCRPRRCCCRPRLFAHLHPPAHRVLDPPVSGADRPVAERSSCTECKHGSLSCSRASLYSAIRFVTHRALARWRPCGTRVKQSRFRRRPRSGPHCEGWATLPTPKRRSRRLRGACRCSTSVAPAVLAACGWSAAHTPRQTGPSVEPASSASPALHRRRRPTTGPGAAGWAKRSCRRRELMQGEGFCPCLAGSAVEAARAALWYS